MGEAVTATAAAEDPSAVAAPPLVPPRATLYVGDLDPSVTEADLFNAFAGVGIIASIRLCRDHGSSDSLRYAYVNFFSTLHAKKALRLLNHVPLNGKPMRIMWSCRDPVSRKSGIGNLFVKNLDASVSGGELEALFSWYGTVESCKVATDEKGRSKGFGFVQMDSDVAALAAIEALNGVIVAGSCKKLYVSKFLRKGERQALPKEPICTNLYIKNLDWDITDDILHDKFSEYGKVISAVVVKDEDGKSRGFGFVSFELPEHAKKALEAMNGSKLGSKSLYVGQAQKKAEREKLLRLQFLERPDQHFKKIKGTTVYVKNLDDSVGDKALQEYFDGCGKIISTKVMLDKTGLSRGFGFVFFSSPEEASKAVAQYNGAMFHDRLLYVAIAQHKEDRHKALQLHFADMSVQEAMHYGFPLVYYTPQYGQLQNSVCTGQQQRMGHFLANQCFENPNQIKQLAYANGSCANKVPTPLKTKNDPFVSQFHYPVHRVNPPQCIYYVQPTRYEQYGVVNNGYFEALCSYNSCTQPNRYGQYGVMINGYPETSCSYSGYYEVPCSFKSAKAVKNTDNCQFEVRKLYRSARVVNKTYYTGAPSRHLKPKPLDRVLAAVDPKQQKSMIREQSHLLVQKLEKGKAATDEIDEWQMQSRF